MEDRKQNKTKHPWTSCTFAQEGLIARVLEFGEFVPDIWLESASQICRLSKQFL